MPLKLSICHVVPLLANATRGLAGTDPATPTYSATVVVEATSSNAPLKRPKPPAITLLPTPTPPNTCNAPVIVEVADVIFVTVVRPAILAPPPTYKLPPIPAPPNGTRKAPVAVDVA